MSRYQSVHTLGLAWVFCTLAKVAAAQVVPTSGSIVCGTVAPPPAESRALVREAASALQKKKASGAPLASISYVPLRPHIFRRTDGTGGFDLASLNQVMAATNNHFLLNGSGIQFYFSGKTPDYIDDDELYNGFQGNLPPNHSDNNAMNQYYAHTFSGGWVGYSGLAQFPADYPNSTHSYVIARSGVNLDNAGNYLLPHELGHNFNLFHTFGFGSGNTPTKELVTRGAGANCLEEGDFICDTPADPFGIPGTSYTCANGCCAYDPNSPARDSNGDAYTPSFANIMSYWPSCTHDFAPGQYSNIQAALALRQTHTSYTLDAPPATVMPPDGLVATFSGQSMQLRWRDNTSSEMGYFIERSTSPTSGFLPINGVAPNTVEFSDTSVIPQTIYYYRIRPSNTTTGSLSPMVGGATAVYNLFVSTTSATQVVLGWNSVNASLQYDLQWRPTGVTAWNTVSSITATTHSLTGLTPNTVYEWRVQGICSGSDCSLFTDAQTFTTAPCSVPTGLNNFLVRAQSASLSWSSGAGYDPGRTYDFRYRPLNTPDWTTVSSVTITSYSLTGLSNNTQYEWQVRSVCAPTVSSDYAPSLTFATFCLSVAWLTGTPAATATSLTWGFNGIPESGSTFELQYRAVGSTNWMTITGPNTGSYNGRTLTGLLLATTYEARVRSSCGPGATTDYRTTTFTTGCYAPDQAYMRAENAQSTTVRLFWSQYTDADTRFELSYRVMGAPDWTTAATSLTVGAYSPMGLTNNTQYEWRVRSVCSPTLSSDFSYGPLFTTRCYFLGTVSTAVFITSATLNWTTDEPVSSYDVQYRETGTANWTIVNNLTSQTLTLNGLKTNTNYEWQLRTRCTDGSYSDFSPIYTFQTSSCTTPYGLAVVTNTSAAQLRWNFYYADAATRYEARYRVPGTATWTVVGNLSSTNTVGTAELTGLQTNTSYEWQIRTLCSATEYSDFVTGPSFRTGCSTPINLFAQPKTTSASVNWAQAGFNVQYDVNYRQSSTTTWTTLSNILSTSATLPGLTSNTGYEWQVRTRCADGVLADFSGVSSFATLACSAPYNLSASFLTTTSARINWSFYQADTQTHYEGRYRIVGAADWTGLPNLNSTDGQGSFDLTDLTPGTLYEWQIKTLCSATESSLFSTSATFRTVCLTMSTIKPGFWNDPAVWSCNRVPIGSDVVQIKHVVTIPANLIAFARQIRFDSGQQLVYSVNAQLKVGQ
ncbi:MAG: fibronectin type III domain-containing protein [Spirosoma sp.]|nr:fibronectin type III domain-containing protein [Spirosoma sp.]